MSRRTILMILFMTILMGLTLSAVFTLQDIGPRSDFVPVWLARFAATYVLVLPTVILVSPIAQWASVRVDRALTPVQPVASSPRDIALAAWRANAAGHAGGSFDPWLDSLAEDVRITMPIGPFRGETIGKAGAGRIYAMIASAEPRLVYEEPLRVTDRGDTVVIEFDDHGTIAGMPYRNRIAASFDVRDGKISAYREYFGDIDPATVAMMTATRKT